MLLSVGGNVAAGEERDQSAGDGGGCDREVVFAVEDDALQAEARILSGVEPGAQLSAVVDLADGCDRLVGEALVLPAAAGRLLAAPDGDEQARRQVVVVVGPGLLVAQNDPVVPPQ